MGDEDYMEQIGELIHDTVKWATRKYGLRAGSVVGPEDVESELWIAAMTKLDKLQPRLEGGERSYVARVLQNAARDALAPDWDQQNHDGGTLEDLEAGLYDPSPRVVASKNPAPAPARELRAARTDFDSAFERMRKHRNAAHVIVGAMATLDPLDAEILQLFIGNQISAEEGWIEPGSKNAAIALEIGKSERTVRRRLATILERLEEMLRDLEGSEAG